METDCLTKNVWKLWQDNSLQCVCPNLVRQCIAMCNICPNPAQILERQSVSTRQKRLAASLALHCTNSHDAPFVSIWRSNPWSITGWGQRFLFAILRHIRNILCNMHVSLRWRQNIRSWWTLQIGSSSSAEMKEYNQWHKCSWWLEKVIVLAAVRPNCRFRIATTISCNLGFYKLHIDNT